MKSCDICEFGEGNLYSYKRRDLCYDCLMEYQAIFENEDHNPFFLAFKRGWETQEKEGGYEPAPIPKWIEEDYKLLFKNHLNTIRKGADEIH